MKRISLMILLAAITLSGMAQTIGEAFYIYRNDGQFNAFFRDEVQAIEYSYYDADSVKYEEIVTQVVITADSVYKIPLAAIDSVGFVQPETVYKKDVTYLGNSLIDYITDISGMNISFRLDLPTNLTPKIGDKIATVEMTELFPYGFFGRVNAVEKTSDAIIVKCDTLSLENAVSRFYCSVKMDNHQTSYANKRASNSGNTLKLDFKPIRFPFELPTIMIEKKDVMGLAGEAKGEWYCDSDLEITVNIVKDDDNKVFYYNINIDGTVTDELSLDIVGGASKEAKLTLFSQDFPPTPGGFYGLTFYMDLGLKAELSGELGFGFTWPSTSKLNLDITFYPNNPLATSVIRRFDMMNNNLSTRYFAGKITGKLGAFFGLGIGVLNHGVGKIGGEFELGLKGDVEFLVDYEELGQSDKSTEYYEKVKNQKADLSSYLGTYFVVSFLEGDNTIMKEYDIDEWIKDFSLKYSWGNDWDIAKLYEGYMFPLFEHISLIRDENDKTRADASFVIPYNSIKKCIVGFKLFDSKGQFIAEKFYPEFYSNKAESSPLYPLTFTGLNEKEVYTVYPCIIIDGHEMLATPKFSEDMILPIAEDVQDFDYTSAELTGRVVSNRNPEDLLVYFQYTKVAELIGEKEEWITVEALYDKENQRYHLTLTDLIPATNYKYHLMCNNSGEEIYSEEKTFSTKDYEVTVDDVLIKSPYSATLTGKIGGYNPSRGYVYFYYTTDWTSGIWKEAHADYIESDGIFTAKVDGLTPSTRYFYKLLYVIYENQYESIPFSFVTNDLSTEIPKINNFNQTVAQYIPNGFEYKQKSYSFRYNCEVALEWNKADNCDDCGYVYEDIEGDTVHVSLKTFASPYSDSRYVYYRNEPISHATLYGYVKYIGDDNFYHGEKTDYPLIYDKQPVATTLEPTYVDETSAKVKCGFKEVAPWGGTCGIEYWEDTNDKDSKKIYFETAQEEIEVTLNDLKPGTIYYYQAFIKVGDEFIMAEEVKHFTTQSAMANLCPDDKHPHLIDLGLPSGTKWACCNVGASRPEENGNYYAWGDAIEKTEFSIDTYSYREFSESAGCEVCTFIGEDISGTEYDIALQKWGNPWCMPSKDDYEELMANCKIYEVTYKGEKGTLFVAPNGKKVFMKPQGYRDCCDLHETGQGVYWTSTYSHEVPIEAEWQRTIYAYAFLFYRDYAQINGYHSRVYGYAVRPIAK